MLSHLTKNYNEQTNSFKFYFEEEQVRKQKKSQVQTIEKVVTDELSKNRKIDLDEWQLTKKKPKPKDFNNFVLGGEKEPKDDVTKLQEIVLNEDVVMLHRYAVLDEKLCRVKIADANVEIKE